MLKPSLILLATVLFIIETDFPEPSVYYQNTGNNSANLTIINNSGNAQYNGMFLNQTNPYYSSSISFAKSSFQIDMFDFTIRNIMRHNLSQQSIYKKLNKYVYDDASLRFARNVMYSYIISSEYKYNNIYAQVAHDSRAGWYNIFAKTRNIINKNKLSKVSEKIRYQNSALSILNEVYQNNINLYNY